MLPMGTIVTVCMLVGILCLIAQLAKTTANSLPGWLFRALGGIVFCAGAWNTFWHGLRNLTNFWGIAALLSGIIMMFAAVLVIRFSNKNRDNHLQRVVALVLLTAFFLLYAITILRL